MLKLAVLVSGTGSLLRAMIQSSLPIAVVIADRACPGIEIAKSAGIPVELLSRIFGKTFDRHQYTLDTLEILKSYDIGLVAMAGYMTLFSPVIFDHYKNRILNIHPALLPAFKGDHAVADALVSGVKVTGTTIHFATANLDEGPILTQEEVPILIGDTVESLHERIKIIERRLYPETIQKLLKDSSI